MTGMGGTATPARPTHGANERHNSHVLRGGSWYYYFGYAYYLCAAYHNFGSGRRPVYTFNDVGFRVVCGVR